MLRLRRFASCAVERSEDIHLGTKPRELLQSEGGDLRSTRVY
jgi:hypothetical protein